MYPRVTFRVTVRSPYLFAVKVAQDGVPFVDQADDFDDEVVFPLAELGRLPLDRSPDQSGGLPALYTRTGRTG